MNNAASESTKGTVNLTGHRLMDRYVVREKIARGGMGVVFRGEDERLQRPVCVKVFQSLDPTRPEYATILEHFVQEAFTLSRLQHPNTLRIYDFGYLDETHRTNPYFITELADAGNLATRIEQVGKLDAKETLRILEPLIGALREAHDAGVVHRDIKPSNILFTYAGGGPVPKLADFSIAKSLRDMPNRAQETNGAVPLYSLSWAAPEQLNDAPVRVQADVFALGLMTAFMLTGRIVYPGNDIIALYSLRSEGPAYREATIREMGLPRAVLPVVLAACAEAVEDRYPSVESFFEALEDALEDTADDPISRVTDAGLSDAGRSDATGPAPFPIAWAEDLYAEIDDDNTPTRPHQAYDVSQLASPHESSVAPTEFPAVVPTPPAPGRADPGRIPPSAVGLAPPPLPSPIPAPHKPRLAIASLAAPVVVLGNRRLRLHEVSEAPLEIGDMAAREPARLRITPNEVGGARAHVKGLNCFVRPAAGRPSSGLDINNSTTLDLLAPTLAVRAQIHVLIGSVVDGAHVFELGEAILAVPLGLASWVVVLELGSGRDALLLYQNRP